MAIVMQKIGGLYFEANRWRQNWQAVDDARGEVVNRNRASFGNPRAPEPGNPPAAGQVDATLADILQWVTDEHMQALNKLNSRLDDRLGDEWREIRHTFYTWLKNNPTATAGQALTAFNAAFPNAPFDPAKLFTRLLTLLDFPDWTTFRDYLVSNFGTIREVI